MSSLNAVTEVAGPVVETAAGGAAATALTPGGAAAEALSSAGAASPAAGIEAAAALKNPQAVTEAQGRWAAAQAVVAPEAAATPPLAIAPSVDTPPAQPTIEGKQNGVEPRGVNPLETPAPVPAPDRMQTLQQEIGKLKGNKDQLSVAERAQLDALKTEQGERQELATLRDKKDKNEQLDADQSARLEELVPKYREKPTTAPGEGAKPADAAQPGQEGAPPAVTAGERPQAVT